MTNGTTTDSTKTTVQELDQVIKKAAISAMAIMYTRGNLKTKELTTLAEKHYLAADGPIPARAAARGRLFCFSASYKDQEPENLQM